MFPRETLFLPDMSGTPIDPLRLEDVPNEEASREAEAPLEATPCASKSGKERKKKKSSLSERADALSSTIQDVLAEAKQTYSEYSDTIDSSSDSDLDSEDENPRQHAIAIDPRRIDLLKVDQKGIFRLSDEKAEYIRRQLSTHLPDDVVKRLVLETAPVPANVQSTPQLDEYFKDLLREQNMGHARGMDATLQKMQENVRNILGPLTAVWADLELPTPDSITIEKMRDSAEMAVILV